MKTKRYITASRRKIEIENWKKIEDSLNNKTVLEGTITKKVKGGYLAQALYYPGFYLTLYQMQVMMKTSLVKKLN